MRGNRPTPSHDYACYTCHSRSWSELVKTFGNGLFETGGHRARSGPRAKTLKCVGNENTGAKQTQKCSNRLNHRNNPSRPYGDRTTRHRAQSKGFRAGTADPAGVMHWHNSFAGEGRRAAATNHSLRRGSPHFRRVQDAVSSSLGAEVGCIGAYDRGALPSWCAAG